MGCYIQHGDKYDIQPAGLALEIPSDWKWVIVSMEMKLMILLLLYLQV